MSKKNKSAQLKEDEEVGDINDIPCVDCNRTYPLVAGASNCRCKRCNTLYKVNNNIEPRPFAKKI